MSTVELDGDDVRRLLRQLDARLERRRERGSVYVVGGAAIAVTVQEGRRTFDVDAIVSGAEVLEEARVAAAREWS